MAFREKLAEKILGRELYQVPVGANPRTYDSAVNGFTRSIFNKRERDGKQLKMYETAYDQGGMVTQAINSYAQFALTNGYRLEGDDPNLVEYVQDWLETFNFNECMRKAIVDSLVFKYAFQEKLLYEDGSMLGLKPAPSRD
jgi:hypothetical protein